MPLLLLLRISLEEQDVDDVLIFSPLSTSNLHIKLTKCMSTAFITHHYISFASCPLIPDTASPLSRLSPGSTEPVSTEGKQKQKGLSTLFWCYWTRWPCSWAGSLLSTETKWSISAFTQHLQLFSAYTFCSCSPSIIAPTCILILWGFTNLRPLEMRNKSIFLILILTPSY